MTKPNEQLIETIQRALTGATPGIWWHYQTNNSVVSDHKDLIWGRKTIADCHKFEDAYLLANAPEWLRFLLEENKRLTREIASHGPEGRNYTNADHVALRLELQRTRERLKRIDAQRMDNEMDARRLRAELSEITESFWKQHRENESLHTELAAKDKVMSQAMSLLERMDDGSDYCAICGKGIGHDPRCELREFTTSYPPREKGADI